MSATVRLPEEDWKARLLGKRLVTASPSWEGQYGVIVFHNEPTRSSLVPNIKESFSSSSPLLRLPAELRFHILTKVFEKLHSNDWLSSHYHAGATPASVIFACKQLYLDGRQLALRACTFDYEDTPSKWRMMICYDDSDILKGFSEER